MTSANRLTPMVAALALMWAACDDATPATPASDTAADVGAADADAAVELPPPGNPYPAPDDFSPAFTNTGPGGPAVTFDTSELYANCAFLDGGPADPYDHHNLVVMFDGFLCMPWAPEFGYGGLTFFDISDPCDPVQTGYGVDPEMRETHAVGFARMGERWLTVVNHLRNPFEGGVQIWDVTDTAEPAAIAPAMFEGYFYPDAYARVSLSVFFQAPYAYVAAADNGVVVFDFSIPEEPQLVTIRPFEPILRAGQIHAIGNLLVVTSAEGTRSAVLDISDPADPQPIPGGDFEVVDAEGEPRESYFSNMYGSYIFYARKEGGGGVIVYDIADPTNPTRAGGYQSDGNGGYVFVKEGFAFVGESNFAALYDVRDLDNITEVTRMDLVGDLDTVTPIGNIAFLSVDDDAERDKGTSAAPWTEEPDATPPEILWAWPADGAVDLAVTSRLGLVFNEMIAPKSAWEGSVRLYETGTDPALTRVDGTFSVQENILNMWPEALEPGKSYTFELPAGGVRDYNGNPLAETYTVVFTTAGMP